MVLICISLITDDTEHLLCTYLYCAVLSHSVMSDSLQPHGDYSPGKNTGVGCHAVLQGIFQTQVFHIAGGFFTV